MADKTDTPPAKDPPADNNKRLAFLEDTAPKVLAVAASLVGSLFGDHEIAPKSKDEDPLLHAIRLLTEAQDRIKEGAGNSDADETIAALEERVRSLEEDLAAAQKSIDAADRGLRAAHRKGVKQVKPRKLGELKDGTDREALIAAMDDGEEFEIVFSTGAQEIVEFDPVVVFPQAFQKVGGGRFTLREAVLVQGAGREHRVRGVALVAGGKQIAYTEFPRPVTVPVGQQVKFDKVIGF